MKASVPAMALALVFIPLAAGCSPPSGDTAGSLNEIATMPGSGDRDAVEDVGHGLPPVAGSHDAGTAMSPAEAELMASLGGVPVNTGKLHVDELRRRLMSPSSDEE